MNLVLAKTETGQALGDIFTLARGRLPGTGRVAEVRQQAFESYERTGLPHRRVEDWKYTDLRALMREVLPLAAAPDAVAIERARHRAEVACGRRRVEARSGRRRFRANAFRCREP